MAFSLKFIKGCAGKVKHKTYLGAQYALENGHTEKNADIYPCECGFYHIGTLAKNKSKKINPERKAKYDNEHKKKYKNVRKFKY